MGRIKTMLIKRTSHELIEKYPTEFKKEFNENKKVVSTRAQVNSKKIRNVIAGYVTRLSKKSR